MGEPFEEPPSEEGPHTLTFQPDTGPMGPGETRYALFSVRTEPESLGGSVQVQPPTWGEESTGLEDYLRFGIAVVDEPTCGTSEFDDSAGAEYVVDPETKLNAEDLTISDPIELEANGESEIHYCIQMELPAGEETNDAQGLSVTPEWEFLGTSTVYE